jgi:hypothetical protein
MVLRTLHQCAVLGAIGVQEDERFWFRGWLQGLGVLSVTRVQGYWSPGVTATSVVEDPHFGWASKAGKRLNRWLDGLVAAYRADLQRKQRGPLA